MAVNVASNLGTKRRRRRGPKGVPTDAFKRARAVGLRRQGRAPASDTRRTPQIARGLPAPARPIKVAKVKAVKPASSATTPTTPPTAPATAPATSPKPPKPAVPAGQPPAYGARRKATLPPGLAKRTGSAPTAATPAAPKGFTPKPPKRPKRPKGY